MNGNVTQRECTSSPGMEDVPHKEWEYASPGMGLCLIGNPHPHPACTWFITGDFSFSPRIRNIRSKKKTGRQSENSYP